LENGVTNRQLFFIIIISALGFSASELPKILGESAGTGAWFTLLLATAFFAVDVFIIVYLGYVYKEKSLFEYSRLLVGKTVSGLFAVIYLVYFFIMLSLIVRSSADTIKAEILFKTPVWATALLILTISLYAASKGLTNIGRIIEYLGLISLVTGFILYFITFTQGDFLNVMPLYDLEEKNRYFNALPSTIFCYLGYEVITIIPFTERNGVKALWTAILSMLVLCCFFILIVESCYAILGLDDIVNYNYPLIIAIRRLDIAIFQFAKRLDLFFIMAWLTSVFCSLSILSFTTAEYVRKLAPKLNKNLALTLTGALAFGSGLIIPNAEDVSELFVRFINYFGLIPAFGIPMLLLIIHFIRAGNKSLKKLQNSGM